MKENFERFDFELEPVDIGGLSALDQGESGRIGPNPEASAYPP
jgi:2,5-diketo-D-gluconate reductase A